LLGAAACAVPFVGGLGSGAGEGRWTPDQVRGDAEVVAGAADRGWNLALAVWRRAEGALAAASGVEDEALYDRLGARHDRALTRLLLQPAPDGAAFSEKLELAVQHLAWEFGAGEACMAALCADARRLRAVRGVSE
jgi:hypothetical protein